MPSGLVNIERGVLDHPRFKPKGRYSKAEAWLWMIFEASWKQRRLNAGETLVTVNRGQLFASLRFMAKRFDWSIKSVRTFLGHLATDGSIIMEPGTCGTLITICNYEQYQNFDEYRGIRRAQLGHADGTPRAQTRTPEEIPEEKPEQTSNTDVREDKTSPALEVIQVLDEVIVSVFGDSSRRQGAHPTDMEMAKEFVSTGVGIEFLREMFLETCSVMNDRGDNPPRTLKYFAKVLRSRLAYQIPFDRSGTKTILSENETRPSIDQSQWANLIANLGRDAELSPLADLLGSFEVVTMTKVKIRVKATTRLFLETIQANEKVTEIIAAHFYPCQVELYHGRNRHVCRSSQTGST